MILFLILDIQDFDLYLPKMAMPWEKQPQNYKNKVNFFGFLDRLVPASNTFLKYTIFCSIQH